VLLLGFVVALSIVAMTGAFGARDGMYRKRGIVVGLILVLAAMVLLLTGRIH
jgi:hypothetical protein